MTVTFQHLSGSYENTDKVVAWNLEQQWTAGNTSSITPTFENGTDEPDYLAQYQRITPNSILVNNINTEFTVSPDDEVNSDTVHSVREEIVITIIAESRQVRIEFEREVNRILWELSPNASTRLSKSDSSDSHVDRFEKSEVTFFEIDITDNDTAYLQGSEGSLFCIYYKFKT